MFVMFSMWRSEMGDTEKDFKDFVCNVPYVEKWVTLEEDFISNVFCQTVSYRVNEEVCGTTVSCLHSKRLSCYSHGSSHFWG